ncbi:two-component system response regulator [Scytonema hofmannii PCC 7110]|uniref:Two-component system response regulator n=1 Tax=Scytonema hofmannii PCC 7110 TaxID=128403 RepID=A0A139X9Y3_9CYAN|nr:response regulator transcription factor [Scytonema hofmannii]KYC41500.1 two-component system response regulator [Scytonema hofmannii PCC 7110]
MKRILIAEDESRIAAFLEKKLQEHSFFTSVATDGYEAVHMARSQNFDLLILDLGLPGKDGTEVIEELRGQGEHIPILILSARDDVNDKVAGLKSGADDYITKPFSFEELLARLLLRLRDRQPPGRKQEEVLKVGNIVLDLPKRQVKVGDRSIRLSNQEFILLDTFMRHPNQVLSREELLNYVWGYNFDPSSNIVDVYVGHLRRKLGENLIETVRGVGYKLQTT